MGFLLMMVALFAVMWFLLIRPQQRKQRQVAAMLQSLEAGQEVMTAGGMYGTIAEIDIEEVVLEIAEGVRVRVDKRAVVNVIEAEEVEDDEQLEAPVEEPEQAPPEAEPR